MKILNGYIRVSLFGVYHLIISKNSLDLIQTKGVYNG